MKTLSPIIECREICKRYASPFGETVAVDNVTFSVAPRDTIIILGHSGSGKTTLLSLIGGLTRPDSGTILISGKDNRQQNDNDLSTLRNETIGFVFQFTSLIPTLTVMENILLPVSFAKAPGSHGQKARDLLAMMGLMDKEKTYPSQLSGGQQRRVAIARAFVNGPTIILADEPTGDLDEETEGEILNFFRNYNNEGITFLIVTHNTSLAATQNNARVMYMKNGRLVEEHQPAAK